MNQKVFKRRVYIAGLLFLLLSIVFIVRLFNLHFSSKLVVSDEKKMDVHRGSIKDRDGYILALSIEKYSLFANPTEIVNPEETAQVLAPLLKLSTESIHGKLIKNKRFVWIKRKLDDSVAENVRKLGRQGLYFKKEYKRVYPHESLAANIVGFVGIDNEGLAGIEYSFDDELAARTVAFGFEDSDDLGQSITLTIDHFIQYSAEREIENAVTANRAKQGMVLVMEVKTGKILALAKYPLFNPNTYYNYSAFSQRNFTVIDSYEPGSTMKVLSLASMLDNIPSLIGSKYSCTGFIDIADARINCTGVHGTIDMNDIIRYSCNVGVIRAMSGLKKKNLYDTFFKFKFGKKTGIELPGESDGIFRHWSTWSGLSKYSMAIGHEISVTSLQLAAAYSAIANRGIYIRPSIIESIEDRNGNVIRRFKPSGRERIISKRITSTILKMMRGVVTGGTGQRAASSYYCVAGKTGTSQKFVRARGYSDRVLSSFVGIAPCDDPEVCMLVVIDDPADKLSGGQIATPVFAGLIDKTLVQLGVKKDHAKMKKPGSKVIRPVYFDGVVMPNFSGARLPETLGALIEMKKKFNIHYSIHGRGIVYGQKPATGTKLEPGGEVMLFLKE